MNNDEKRLAHIPDRDQIFHDMRDRSEAQKAAEKRASWSGDIEQEVEGERDFHRDADAEITSVVPPTPLAMPGQAHMDARLNRQARSVRTGNAALAASDLASLGRSLAERRYDLERLVVAHQRYIREQLAPIDDQSRVDFNHPADTVNVDSDYGRELQLVARERAELTLVNQALNRIDEGTYGVCEECTAEIPASRLYALPYARFCLACQKTDESDDGVTVMR